MAEHWSIYADWNPWHGCTKISPGCKYCYVYRQDEMYGSEIGSNLARKTAAFNLPVKRKRDRSWKIEPGKVVFTCFTSDFLLKDADDWADGYDNVLVGCTVENQQMADYRLPIFKSLPIKHKSIIVSPLISAVDISDYLDSSIEEVSVGGESGVDARPCNYDWVLDLRRQCVEKDVPFRFHQTGAKFIKDGKQYYVRRPFQLSQAHKANIDYKIDQFFVPEKVKFEWKDSDYRQEELFL